MQKRKSRKTLVGRVVSNRMEKTVAVNVERTFQHAKYGKTIKRTSKIYAHDDGDSCGIGDKVRVMSTRPLSRLKRWRVVEIIEKGQ